MELHSITLMQALIVTRSVTVGATATSHQIYNERYAL